MLDQKNSCSTLSVLPIDISVPIAAGDPKQWREQFMDSALRADQRGPSNQRAPAPIYRFISQALVPEAFPDYLFHRWGKDSIVFVSNDPAKPALKVSITYSGVNSDEPAATKNDLAARFLAARSSDDIGLKGDAVTGSVESREFSTTLERTFVLSKAHQVQSRLMELDLKLPEVFGYYEQPLGEGGLLTLHVLLQERIHGTPFTAVPETLRKTNSGIWLDWGDPCNFIKTGDGCNYYVDHIALETTKEGQEILESFDLNQRTGKISLERLRELI